MKDIPVFASEFGAASLILREVPYKKIAYVRIQASEQPHELIGECVSFCRACGAEQICAAGHPALEHYPFHTAVVRMRCRREELPETDAALWPVLPENVAEFRELYNRRMAQVPNASWMTIADGETLVSSGEGYFVHRGGGLLGIGRAAGEEVKIIISACPGAGRDVVLAMNHVLQGDSAILEVATANTRAVRLYEKLGFLPTEELSRWYRVYP